jgi:hypothetical protein
MMRSQDVRELKGLGADVESYGKRERTLLNVNVDVNRPPH